MNEEDILKEYGLTKEKLSYMDRYSKISQSEWFEKSYKDRSIGDLINTD